MLPGWYYLAVAVQGEGERRSLAIDVSVGGTRELGPAYTPDPSLSATTARSTTSPGRIATSGNPAPGAAAQPTGGNQDSAGAGAAFGGPAVWLGLPLALLLGAGLATWVIRLRGPETPCT